jgi:hypothetical protein
MLLARRGFKVLLVDRATFPSDTLSTHILWPHGAEIPDRWGLLRCAARSPTRTTAGAGSAPGPDHGRSQRCRGFWYVITPEGNAMYVIREVLHCKPGKVRPMIEKFRGISAALKQMGQEPLRLLTDVSAEPFWTIVAEARVEKIDDFFAFEQKLMTNESLREMMADYHDLVDSGRREISRVES